MKPEETVRRWKTMGLVKEILSNSGGPGGQHSNRTFNAVEFVVIERPEIRAKATAKSQSANRRTAARMLVSRLVADKARRDAEERTGRRNAQKERVRSYVFYRQELQDAAGVRSVKMRSPRGGAGAFMSDAAFAKVVDEHRDACALSSLHAEVDQKSEET